MNVDPDQRDNENSGDVAQSSRRISSVSYILTRMTAISSASTALFRVPYVANYLPRE